MRYSQRLGSDSGTTVCLLARCFVAVMNPCARLRRRAANVLRRVHRISAILKKRREEWLVKKITIRKAGPVRLTGAASPLYGSCLKL